MLFLRGISTFRLAAVLARAGGGVLFLVAHAILGELVKHEKMLVLVGFAVGVVAIGALNLVVWAR